MFDESMPLRPRGHLWRWVLGGSVVVASACSLAVILSGGQYVSELLSAVLGGGLGTAFFFHRGHSEDARFMKELFEYFNKRYDDQNNDLQAILKKNGDFDKKDELAFIDYFNLCAEEWVFRKAGYIYDPVWRAWENGMRQYGRDGRVAKLWEDEKKSGSYYGFEFPAGELSKLPDE